MHVVTVKPESLFQALSDATRIRIVRLLAVSEDEVCLCDLADTLLEPEYKLSRHLKVLRQAGLLDAERDGKWVYHRLVFDSAHLKSLYRYIKEIPDGDKSFSADLKRFEKRKKARQGLRCKTTTLSQVKANKRIR